MVTESHYHPGFPLNQFVQVIWTGKANNLQASSAHHAALFTELIFNYGDLFSVTGQHIEENSSKGGHHIISGLKTAPFHTQVGGSYCSVGLILAPHCYGELLKHFGSTLMDDLADLLYDQLLQPSQPDFSRVEKHLLRLFKHYQPDPDLRKFEAFVSAESLRKGALKQFNQRVSMTEKGFIQKFKERYQLTPNQFIKLSQVNYALQQMRQAPTEKLSQIGLEAGFYDQSHFIREFKKFCGITPKKLQLQPKLLPW